MFDNGQLINISYQLKRIADALEERNEKENGRI